MSELASFLESEKNAIIELFVRRSQHETVARTLPRRRLVDHLPDFLKETALTLRTRSVPSESVFAESVSSEKHGEQRHKDGYDVEEVVREYGVLLDCVLERLEVRGLQPSFHELRVLTGSVSASSHAAVTQYLREQAQSAERERVRLLDVFESAPSFVAVLSGPEHRFEMTNGAYLKLIGHRDALGKTVAEVLPEVVPQGYVELLDRVYRGGEPIEGKASKVVFQDAAEGTTEEAFVDFIYAPVFDSAGTVTGVMVEGHDVTQSVREQERRQEVEQSLRTSEERFRTMLENIDEGFCVIEMLPDQAGNLSDWRYLQVNAAFVRQSGFDDAVGKRIRELVPQHDQFWFDLYANVVRSGEPARAEFHAEAMDRWFDVFAVRLGQAGSRQLAVLFRDTSQGKRAEAERERLLAMEVEARQRSEEVGRFKDEFLATLSHELRTPLHSMLGWVTLLQRGQLSLDKRERALAIIARNAHAQSQLIDDLLDMSRIMAGKLRLELAPVDLCEVLEAQIESAKPSADAKSIRIVARLSPQVLIDADSQRLQQVVWNLLSNSIKFTPAGGEVRVSLVCNESGAAEFTVTDTGRGIAPDFLPHVFDRFRQESRGSARSQGGLGLGLAITRQLIELHGGTITATSAGEGHGATFAVRLPLAVAQRSVLPPQPHAALDSASTLAGVRVMVVDDDDDSREMLRVTLETFGMHVQVASSAADCKARVGAEPHDLLISDIGMPDEDGFSLIRSLRASASAPNVRRLPAVALTAFARQEDRTRALEAGFDAYLTKPVEVEDLLRTLDILTSRARRDV